MSQMKKPSIKAAEMSQSKTGQCPSCHKPASGRFCSSCGAQLGARNCPDCGSELSAGNRFCPSCGVPAGAGAPRQSDHTSVRASGNLNYWVMGVAAMAIVVALVALLKPTAVESGPAPTTTSASGAAAIDLASMTPRERFDRLYDRVMRASEGGDQGTVTQFAPMALQAYAQLDTVDSDARYHAAMIRLHTGDPVGATTLADTILALDPGHLFSTVIYGTVARLNGDQERLAKERSDFLKRYDNELARRLPEYDLHKFILDQFLTEARGTAANGASK